MPFSAIGLQVLVSSPSDTAESRVAVKTAIAEWNDLNAVPLGVVLVPRFWEISAVGGFSAPAQGLLNEQLVDNADIVIGIFWTRLGTPTGSAESGTVEEIERAISNGVDVLLYFSEAPVHPASVESSQLDAVRKFREKMKLRGLLGVYDSESELKDRVIRDLTRLVRARATEGRLAATESVALTSPSHQALADQLNRYRSELRGLAAESQMYWGPLKDNSDSDGVRRLAAAVAQEVSKYLAVVAGLDAEQSGSELYNRLLQLGQKASHLSRMRIYMDGGQSWRALNEGLGEVLDGLLALAGSDWRQMLLNQHPTSKGPAGSDEIL